MDKVLFVATVDSHIRHFHIPYLKYFKENGYEVHVATSDDENEVFDYCDYKHKIPFERKPFKWNNIKAIKQMTSLIKDEKFDIITCHTPMGGVVTRLAVRKLRKHHSGAHNIEDNRSGAQCAPQNLPNRDESIYPKTKQTQRLRLQQRKRLSAYDLHTKSQTHSGGCQNRSGYSDYRIICAGQIGGTGCSWH